jgi:hypothetical protein
MNIGAGSLESTPDPFWLVAADPANRKEAHEIVSMDLDPQLIINVKI